VKPAGAWLGAALAAWCVIGAPARAQTDHPRMTPAAVAADRAAFRACLAALRPEALRAGVAAAVFDRELAAVEPDMRLVDLLRGQPEFERPIWEYVDGLVTRARLDEARTALARHADLLGRIERAYGVDRFTLVGLWAAESHFGRSMGDRPIVRSTATLACIGRRQEFFRSELLAALHLLSGGDIPSARLRGSWAGAFGHMQFMPSTFRGYAVDFDGDGRRDPIGSVADALASAANKLKGVGWLPDRPWGFEVLLPAGFDYRLAASDRRMTFAEWEGVGVRRPGGRPFERADDVANLLLPAGVHGPAFLVLANFHALRAYNTSDAYAVGVGHLADRLRGAGPIERGWPRHLRPLSRVERVELQQRLTALGLDTGGTEGRIGARTRDAVRGFQLRVGLVPDGFPSHEVLERLRR
jgi:lytic murein transglycosylase